jgi:hypothetical protein
MTPYSKYPDLPAPLPARIRLANGTTRTSLDDYTDAQLAQWGYYPVTEVKEPLADGMQYGTPSLAFNGLSVLATYPQEPAPPPSRVIRDHQFRNRFTDEQLDGIQIAGNSGDILALRVQRQLFTASDGVDLNDHDVQGMVQMVAAAYPALAIDPLVILV